MPFRFLVLPIVNSIDGLLTMAYASNHGTHYWISKILIKKNVSPTLKPA